MSLYTPCESELGGGELAMRRNRQLPADRVIAPFEDPSPVGKITLDLILACQVTSFARALC